MVDKPAVKHHCGRIVDNENEISVVELAE